MLEEAAREKMELNKKHYEEVERAKMVLDKLQTTYQHQVLQYEGQTQAVVIVIQELKNESKSLRTTQSSGWNGSGAW